MKYLQEQLSQLREDIYTEYQSFMDNRLSINFAQKAIDEWDEEGKQELQELLKYEDYIDMFEYDFFEFLPETYYMNKYGEEISAFILRVDWNGIYILCNETDKAFYIGLSNISSLTGKVELLTEIENF